jgi:hypothetical protein
MKPADPQTLYGDALDSITGSFDETLAKGMPSVGQ